MPGKNQPPLLLLRGSDEYDRFLDDLRAELVRRGMEIPSRAALVEAAIRLLADTCGLTPPRRSRPLGANQHDAAHDSPAR